MIGPVELLLVLVFACGMLIYNLAMEDL